MLPSVAELLIHKSEEDFLNVLRTQVLMTKTVKSNKLKAYGPWFKGTNDSENQAQSAQEQLPQGG